MFFCCTVYSTSSHQDLTSATLPLGMSNGHISCLYCISSTPAAERGFTLHGSQTLKQESLLSAAPPSLMPMVCLQLKHSPSPYNQRLFLSVDHQKVSPVMQQQNCFFIWRLDQSFI